ncbi:hypothetical protein CRE_20601 [Caenorhabditis remanei]|uniref:Uncharacterized protein n=1 Tax=Caenorhabditis remanei TaxID=31234 RepID=E3NKU9_CAERE|nr:hypothetical protein CRE_20601 [Caenorhabditis remanei]
MNLKISCGSVQTIVKRQFNNKSYKLCKGQFFSAQSKALRLEKKLLADLQVRRVSDLIWTNEKIFTFEPLFNRQNQRQLLSQGDSNSPKRRQAHEPLFPKSFMVWPELTSNGKTLFVFINRNEKINSGSAKIWF